MSAAPAIEAHELAQFRALVTRLFGLVFEDRSLTILTSVLSHRLDKSQLSAASYLMRLETQPAAEELRALARELTIGETYFFRNIEQFNAFTEVVLRARAREPGRAISLLSLGCASGEEPYTLAMLLRDHVGDAQPWSIHALDISSTKLDHARAGRYARWSLRETPPEAQQRWFRQSGAELLLDERIRTAVTFEEYNVVRAHPWLFREPRFDAVFCRNMLMYLEPQLVARVVAQIARALVPGGFLFLGHAESLRGVSGDFQLCSSHGAFYYQKQDAPLGHAITPPGDWLHTISNANRRIEALTDGGVSLPEHVTDTADSGARTPGAPRLDAALRLLQDERFSEALAELAALPGQLARDPNALLLRAVLLTHTGDFQAAKQVCAELLMLDDLHAGAHYLFGLCCEGEGDELSASDHDRTAVHLDPTFAMPRLHLGLLARRSGDSARARHDLVEALALLQHESTNRLVLFGGGFKRDALLSLCRAEPRRVRRRRMSLERERVLAMRREFDRAFAEPHAPSDDAQEDLLRVRVGADSYVLRVSEIAAVLVDQSVLAVASEVREWLGISAQRGQIIAVYDLAALLGTNARNPARWLAVLGGSADVALAFEQFEGHLRVSKTDVLSSDAQAQKSHVTHLVRTAESTLPLLGCDALLRTIADLARVVGPSKERG